jgi:hypothetical protein
MQLVIDPANGNAIGVAGPFGGVIPFTGVGKPDAPQNVVATAVAGGVSVSFDPPSNSHGSSVFKFWAVLSNGRDAAGSASPIFVPSPPGVAVTAKVKCANGIGWSDFSDVSNSVTPSAMEWATRLWSAGVSFSVAKNFFQTVGTMADGGFGTVMIVTELMGHADMFAPLLHNYATDQVLNVVSVKVHCPAALGDLKYDAAFAALPDAVIDNGSTTTTVGVRPTASSNAHPTIKATSPIAITTVDRTDVIGGRPLVAYRIVFQFPTPATQNFGYWSPIGALWDTDPGLLRSCARVGDFRSTAIDSAPQAQSAFRQCGSIGFRVRYKTKAMTVAAFGSSVTLGNLVSLPNKRSAGYVNQAAVAVSTMSRPIEYMNCGFAGYQLDKSLLAANDLLPMLKPNHVIVEVANINNFPNTDTTVAEINAARSQAQAIFALADSYGATKVAFNSWGRNQSGSPYTGTYFTAAASAKQNAYLAEWASAGYRILDTRSGMNTGESPDRVKMAALGYAADYLNTGEATTVHQSDYANTNVILPAATAMMTALAAAYAF